jgi:hypothetical protein
VFEEDSQTYNLVSLDFLQSMVFVQEHDVHFLAIHDMLLAPDDIKRQKTMHSAKDQKAPFHHYDSENIFARILRKELDCRIVLETEHTLAFHDRFNLLDLVVGCEKAVG